MNERVANIGNQLRQALGRLREAWANQEQARKKRIIYIVIGLVVLAVGLVVVLNIVSGRYVVLWEGMSRDESVRAVAVLDAVVIPSKIDTDGQLQVPSNKQNQAMAQLATEGIPSTSLNYNLLAQASGLTTTESEKRAYEMAQWQVRLEDIIKTFDGVRNAYVNLHVPEGSTRLWEPVRENTGAVTLHLAPNYVLSSLQITGIRHLVGNSVGIDPMQVSITDNTGNLLAATGATGADLATTSTAELLQRLDVARDMETDLVLKAVNQLSLLYPDSERYRATATVRLDWNKLVTETKTYIPLDETIHGVMSREELQAIMNPDDYAEGVVGETDNTDVPIYVDLNGDGELEVVNYARYRDFLVSYVLDQEEKDGPEIGSISLAILINDTLGNETQQLLRDNISKATGIAIENVNVQGYLVPGTGEPETPGTSDTIFGIPIFFLYIAAGVLVLLVAVLIVISVLRSKARKKRLAEEAAALAAEEEEAERIQREIEERKLQLKNAAMGDQSENAISNEVKEFARNNPEITANLLRNWLREGE
ncbi:MAG: flagellar M-ring protein FliF C-terminal domain-containing protein [Oscillospiraceae bacterium]